MPHGLRSTFLDSVAEKTSSPGNMAEIALSHEVGSAVVQVYRRSDMLEKRRQTMEGRAAFLSVAGGR